MATSWIRRCASQLPDMWKPSRGPCRDVRYLHKPWFRLDLDIDIKDDVNDDMTASEKRKIQKQWSFAKKASSATPTSPPLWSCRSRSSSAARAAATPCVSALSHLQYVPPRAITCPWDGASGGAAGVGPRRPPAAAGLRGDGRGPGRDVRAGGRRQPRAGDARRPRLRRAVTKKRNYAENVRSHDLDDEECELEPADTSLGRARNAVKKGGLGPSPPALPKDVHAIARELDSRQTTIESASTSLDASPRRLCALTECDASIVRAVAACARCTACGATRWMATRTSVT